MWALAVSVTLYYQSSKTCEEPKYDSAFSATLHISGSIQHLLNCKTILWLLKETGIVKQHITSRTRTGSEESLEWSLVCQRCSLLFLLTMCLTCLTALTNMKLINVVQAARHNDKKWHWRVVMIPLQERLERTPTIVHIEQLSFVCCSVKFLRL